MSELRTHSASSSSSTTSFNIAPVIGAALAFASAHRPNSPASFSSSSSGTPIPNRRLPPHIIPSTRSRGQLARRNSTNLSQAQQQNIIIPSSSAAESHSVEPYTHTRSSSDVGRDLAKRGNRSRSPSRRREQTDYSERPLLGGLYFSDLVVVAFFYALNLVRTCGLAEIGDVLLKGLAWAIVALPKEFWRRWSLSANVYSTRTQRYGPSSTKATQQAFAGTPVPINRPDLTETSLPDRSDAQTPLGRTHRSQYGDLTSSISSASTVMPTGSSSATAQPDLLSPFPSSTEPAVPLPQQSSSAFSSFSEQQHQHEGHTQSTPAPQHKTPTHDQLSPFHHLIILLTRFACSNFPHLLPRVLFAEDTIGPLVRWRTGGGAAGLVREFGAESHQPYRSVRSSDLPSSERPSMEQATDDDDHEGGTSTRPSLPPPGPAPAFRAFWIGTDAHVPPQVRREREKPDPNRPQGASERAPTTILYLHGGGFSLGSVAFYAEALIRTLGKICILEQAASARCIAVEYDLAPAPSARFPAPLLQCLRCYAHLIEVEGIPAESITIAGDSAGANLAMGILLCLNGGEDVVKAASEPGVDLWGERDWSALPMPGQAVLISPWADLRPSKAITFERLRGAGAQAGGQTLPTEKDAAGQSTSSSEEAKLRDAISGFEWDYVLPETLLHFAQVYTGVMEVPRRVRGPIGWISHVCGIVGAALEKVEEDAARPAKRARGDAEAREAAAGSGAGLGSTLRWTRQALDTLGFTPAVGAFARVPRRMTMALKEMLDEPLLGFGSGSGAKTEADVDGGLLGRGGSSGAGGVGPGSSSVVQAAQGGGAVSVGSRATHGLAPLFPAQERRTETVPDTSDLFVPFTDVPAALKTEETTPSLSGQPTASASASARGGRVRTPEEAARLLDTSPLISPAIADWSSIRLERGMLVTWGERERLASDIQAWVRRIRTGVPTKEEEGGGGSALDDEEDLSETETEKGDNVSSSLRSGDWLVAAVEHGPGGVHAWPFVSMYLAGTETEREKGLELLARFIAQDPLAAPLAALHQASAAEQDDEKYDPAQRKDDDFGEGDDVDTFDDTPSSFSSSAGSMPSDSAPYGEETDEAWYRDSEALSGVRTSERVGGHSESQRGSGSGSGSGDYFRHQPFHARSSSRSTTTTRQHQQESVSDVATEEEEDSSEGSSSPEGRVTALGGAPAIELESSSVGLGLGPLPPPMLAPVATTRSGMAPQVQQTGSAAYARGYAGVPYASAPASSGAGSYSGYAYQSVPAPCYVEEAARRERERAQALALQQQEQQQQQQQYQHQYRAQQYQREERELTSEEDEEEDMSDLEDEEDEEEHRSRGLEDIEEVSEGALSPDSYPSSPTVSASASAFTQSLSALPIQMPVPMPSELGFYGFSHYTLPNREPEGLSDIMEEGSVLSASVTSGGVGGGPNDWPSSSGASSPSPIRGRQQQQVQGGPFMFGSGIAPAPTFGTVMAGEVGYMHSSYPMEGGESFEGVASEEGEIGGDEDEDEGETEAEAEEGDADNEGREDVRGSTSPGSSLRTVQLLQRRSSQSSIGSGGEKPKGDVWW
ncbi:hypothetical protein CF326_g5371 [Tilletia indica]|nr:hypothetical protein CF326_g5371 [Tilletia indica]